MTLFLDGIFAITMEAGWMVLTNDMNHAYFDGRSDEPLGDRSYTLPQGNRILCRSARWASGCNYITVEVEMKELQRLISISKLVSDVEVPFG